jgi:hypothetical protein
MTAARPCRGCTASITGARVRYCPTCRARRCVDCHRRDGTHSPACRFTPHTRPCQGCGLTIPAGKGRYCADCRLTACPECRRIRGAHGAQCRYEQRQHRAPPEVVDEGDRITDDDVVALFLAYGRQARFLARHYGPPGEVDDVIGDVIAYLLGRKAFVSHRRSVAAYFLAAVKNMAIRRWRYSYLKSFILADEHGLMLAELKHRRLEYGKRAYSNERPNTPTPMEGWQREPVA